MQKAKFCVAGRVLCEQCQKFSVTRKPKGLVARQSKDWYQVTREDTKAAIGLCRENQPPIGGPELRVKRPQAPRKLQLKES